jgi:hypothetical protein
MYLVLSMLIFKEKKHLELHIKATANVMYFKKPFRTDSYKQHLEDQHPEHWKQYQSTSDALENNYFQDKAPAVSF